MHWLIEFYILAFSSQDIGLVFFCLYSDMVIDVSLSGMFRFLQINSIRFLVMLGPERKIKDSYISKNPISYTKCQFVESMASENFIS